MTSALSRPRITAVLGPTNTGKTHFAIERMLDYPSGMIGFPLRLLARENYDRVVALKGASRVALVTGEEKIVPANPSYFLCTVESMPLDRPVDFLAVDEIQLAADPERGHVFTDRLLQARGEAETMFVGAETVRRIVRRLVSEAVFVSRPRLSSLTYTGPRKLSRLPPRAAIVGFSAADVYALAELVRRQRGGAAVVLGALSPRTRNAQVAMYQDGEVDYLVATDAIGMGLNMNIRHVAFAGLSKFDGRGRRRLSPAEVAQIAGRAGRYLNDGTFGTTAGLEPLDAELVDAVENHRFESLRAVFWRNGELEFASPAALLRSLEAPPPSRELMRVRAADDEAALANLACRDDITRLVTGPSAVRLLWEVCQIPDFRKIMPDVHARLLGNIFLHLAGNGRRLPTDWVAKQIDRIDRTDGDIDTLVGRIDHIRTWTYVSHRPDWLDDAGHWQDRARAIEDRLSDALHERLTQRFVDRRAAALVRRMRESDHLVGSVTRGGEVMVEGEQVGRLEGFRFIADESESLEEAQAVRTAVQRALRGDIAARVARLVAEPDGAFRLSEDGIIAWRGAPVARLRPGPTPLAPRAEPLPSALLEPPARDRLRQRLDAWLAAHLADRLRSLFEAREARIDGPARGVVYQLVEALGALPRRAVEDLLTALDPAGRKDLARLGVRLGRESVYLSPLLRPPAVRLRRLLWSVHHGDEAPQLDATRIAVPLTADVPEGFYFACGYRPCGGVAVRVDRLERLAAAARKLARQGPFTATPALVSLACCAPEALPSVLHSLGYLAVEDAGGTSFMAAKRMRRKLAKRGRSDRGRRRGPDPDSPFAALRDLVSGK